MQDGSVFYRYFFKNISNYLGFWTILNLKSILLYIILIFLLNLLILTKNSQNFILIKN